VVCYRAAYDCNDIQKQIIFQQRFCITQIVNGA
jgi:hypothetical protein